MNKPKFRAWDEYEKEMLENVIPMFDETGNMVAVITDFQLVGSPGTSEIEIGSCDTTLNWDDFPYILMKYTGLKDKNGVEIYEGDVCFSDGGLDDYWYVVEWVFAGWQTVTYKKPESSVRGISDGVNQSYLEPDIADYLTVIGNIHENPELLSGVE